jgi:hypothetical protein
VSGGKGDVTESCEVSVSVCFVSGSHITPPTPVTVGEVVTERNASLLVSGELDNGYCDALLLVEEKQILGIIDEDFTSRFAEKMFCR